MIHLKIYKKHNMFHDIIIIIIIIIIMIINYIYIALFLLHTLTVSLTMCSNRQFYVRK